MKCPACYNELTEMKMGRLAVDVCEGGCGGVWLDNFELQRLDDPNEFAGTVLQEISYDPKIQVDPSQRRKCPRCGEIVLMRHFYSEERRVQVDTCPGCGGIWLDAGELAIIRQECGKKEDKKSEAEQYFHRMFQQDWMKLRKRAAQDS